MTWEGRALAVLALVGAGCGGGSGNAPSAAVAEAPAAEEAAPAADQETYAIRLDRRLHPGDEMELAIAYAVTVVTTRTAGGAEPTREEDAVRGQLAVQAIIEEVDGRGRALRTRYRIEHAQLDQTGRWEPWVPDGTVALTTRDGVILRLTFPEGAPEGLDDEGKRCLVEALNELGTGGNDDTVLGTAELRAVGDHWPVDAAGMSAHLRSTAVGAHPEDLHGDVVLEGTEESGGIPCIDVVAEYHVSPFTHADLGVDEAAEDASFAWRYEVLLPRDPALPPLRQEQINDLRWTERFEEDGAPVEVRHRVEGTVRRDVQGQPSIHAANEPPPDPVAQRPDPNSARRQAAASVACADEWARRPACLFELGAPRVCGSGEPEPVCVCHECATHADCAERPGGRCVASEASCTEPARRTCVYPDGD